MGKTKYSPLQTENHFQLLATRLVEIYTQLVKGEISQEVHDQEAVKIKEEWASVLQTPAGVKWKKSYKIAEKALYEFFGKERE